MNACNFEHMYAQWSVSENKKITLGNYFEEKSILRGSHFRVTGISTSFLMAKSIVRGKYFCNILRRKREECLKNPEILPEKVSDFQRNLIRFREKKLVWLTMATEAWVKIWFLVSRATSSAMSASLIVESAALRFSTEIFRLAKVWVNRFLMAPSLPRLLVKVSLASLTASRALRHPGLCLP